VKVLARKFKYNTITLDDPDPKWTPEKVKEFYSNVYPELTQAVIMPPSIGEDGLEYKFEKTYGTKGVITVTELAEREEISERDNADAEKEFSAYLANMGIMNLIGTSVEQAGKRIPVPAAMLEPI